MPEFDLPYTVLKTRLLAPPPAVIVDWPEFFVPHPAADPLPPINEAVEDFTAWLDTWPAPQTFFMGLTALEMAVVYWQPWWDKTEPGIGEFALAPIEFALAAREIAHTDWQWPRLVRLYEKLRGCQDVLTDDEMATRPNTRSRRLQLVVGSAIGLYHATDKTDRPAAHSIATPPEIIDGDLLGDCIVDALSAVAAALGPRDPITDAVIARWWGRCKCRLAFAGAETAELA